MQSLNSIFTFAKRHMKVEKQSKTKVTMLESLKNEFSVISTGSRTEEIACLDRLDSKVSDADQLVLIMKLNEQEVKKCLKISPENPTFAWIDVTHDPLLQQRHAFIILNKGYHSYLAASKAKQLESIQTLIKNEKISFEKKMFERKQTTPDIVWKAKPIKDQMTEAGIDMDEDTYRDFNNIMLPLPDIDVVPAIACQGWPNTAAGSLKRIEKRYGADLAQKMKSYGHHYVAKTRVGGEPDLDWRISFSVAEWTIVDQWSDTQRVCHIFLKRMLNNHLDIPAGIVTTYHLKTLMLWEVETKPKEFWSQTYICNCILVILEDLLHAVVLKELPHYFIDLVNLFAITDSCHLNQVAVKLNWLRNNPDLIIPDKRNKKVWQDQEGCKRWIIQGDKFLRIPATNADHNWNACSMSETAVNVAALTLREYSLGFISKQQLREREMLLNAFIFVVQKIFTSIPLTEDNIEVSEEKTHGASQLSQTKRKRSAYESMIRQLQEVYVLLRLRHLKEIMEQPMDLKPSTITQITNDKQLFEFYLTYLANTPDLGDTCVDLCQHGSDYITFISIYDIANATTSFFHF